MLVLLDDDVYNTDPIMSSRNAAVVELCCCLSLINATMDDDDDSTAAAPSLRPVSISLSLVVVGIDMMY